MMKLFSPSRMQSNDDKVFKSTENISNSSFHLVLNTHFIESKYIIFLNKIEKKKKKENKGIGSTLFLQTII